MSKNSKAVYKSYSALAADSAKGGVESGSRVLEMVRCLREVGDGA